MIVRSDRAALHRAVWIARLTGDEIKPDNLERRRHYLDLDPGGCWVR